MATVWADTIHFAAAGGMTTRVAPTRLGAAAFAATGVMTAKYAPVKLGSAAFVGSGALLPHSVMRYAGGSLLAGSGALMPLERQEAAGGSLLAASGSFGAVVTAQFGAVAQFAAYAALDVNVLPEWFDSASLSGTGALFPQEMMAYAGGSLLAGSGTLAASFDQIPAGATAWQASAAFAGVGSMQHGTVLGKALGGVQWHASTALFDAGAPISGAGTLDQAGYAGGASMTAAANLAGAQSGAVVFAANGVLTANTPWNLVASYPGTSLRANYSGAVGFQFVLATKQTFNLIGLRGGSGTTGARNAYISQSGVGTPLVTQAVDLTNVPQGQFTYVRLSSPIQLSAGVTYALFAAVTSDNVQFWSDSSATTLNNATSVTSVYGGNPPSGSWSIGTANQQFFGIDLANGPLPWMSYAAFADSGSMVAAMGYGPRIAANLNATGGMVAAMSQYVTGQYGTIGYSGPYALPSKAFTEHELGLQLVDAVPGDTFSFQFQHAGLLYTYTYIPGFTYSGPQLVSMQYQAAGTLGVAPWAIDQASARLVANGYLLTSALPARAAYVGLAGSGVLRATLTPFSPNNAAFFAGSGSLTAQATQLAHGAVGEAISESSLSDSAVAPPTGTAWAGAAAFAASGVMVANAIDVPGGVQWQASAAFAATGALALQETMAWGGFASFAASGGLGAVATGFTNWQASATFSGTGALLPQETMVHAGAAALAGSGVLSANVLPEWFDNAEFDASGNLTASAAVIAAGAAALSASGALNATASGPLAAAATFAGSGVLSANVLPEWFDQAAFAAQGALGANVNGTFGTVLNVSATGVLGAAPVLIAGAGAGLSGTGVLGANATRLPSGTSAGFSGTGALSATATVTATAGIAIAAQGSLSAVPAVSLAAQAQMAASGLLGAFAGGAGGAGAVLTAVGSLSANLFVANFGYAALAGAGSLGAVASVEVAASAALAGSGSLAAAATVVTTSGASASLTGQGSLTAVASIIGSASAVLTGEGDVSSYGGLTAVAGASMVANGVMIARVQAFRRGVAARKTTIFGRAQFIETMRGGVSRSSLTAGTGSKSLAAGRDPFSIMAGRNKPR